MGTLVNSSLSVRRMERLMISRRFPYDSPQYASATRTEAQTVTPHKPGIATQKSKER
jgi:hypothetical protein